MHNTEVERQRARERASNCFDDADVLPVEDTDARADAIEPDAWMRPRKIELGPPTVVVLAAALAMALFYQATHPHELDAPPEAAGYRLWIDEPIPAPAPSARLRMPVQPDAGPAPVAVPSVAGAWSLATHVESSRYSRFAGMRLGYEVELEQDGRRVSGLGRKILENGDGIAARAQTPIAVNGTVAGDRVMLDFTERGALRETHGTFVLTRAGDGALRGRFATSAARSAGSVEARRVR